MPAMTVVEELVVLLRLNSEPYKKADREIDKSVATTEKKLKKVDEARTKRMHESTRAVKQFATSMRALALTVRSVCVAWGCPPVNRIAPFRRGARRPPDWVPMPKRGAPPWRGSPKSSANST